jgi:nicotinamidase-related amidase
LDVKATVSTQRHRVTNLDSIVRPMTRCLLIIDIQNDYFPGGAYPLHEPEAAAAAAGQLLARFRADGQPVVHVQHIWDAADATFMRPGTPGVEIHASVAPIDGEPVVSKAYPNAFRATSLAQLLDDLLGDKSVDALVVAGMMTSMCVDATVRAAADLEFSVTVVGDACAAPDLEYGGRTVAAADVHAAFLAALADSSPDLTRRPPRTFARCDNAATAVRVDRCRARPVGAAGLSRRPRTDRGGGRLVGDLPRRAAGLPAASPRLRRASLAGDDRASQGHRRIPGPPAGARPRR